MERDFKGVWIPKEIWLNEELGWSEKILLVEIDSLSKNGECFASNEYFAKFMGCHKKHISRLVSSLTEKGLIKVDLIYKPDSKQIDKRIIHVPTRNKNVPTPPQKCSDPRNENVPTPRNKKVEDINTSFNNTINNTVNKKRDINTLTKKAVEQEFEALWKLYPRKEGKKNALNSYIKARKEGKTTYAEVEKGIERYIEYIKARKKDKELIKHGSTWFNQHAWTDEYDAASLQIQQELSKFNQLMLKNMESPDDFFSLMGVGDQYESRRVKKVIDVS